MRCVHTNHKKSTIPYRLKEGAETTHVPIVLGYNIVHRRFEMCDEGLVYVRYVKTRKRRVQKEED